MAGMHLSATGERLIKEYEKCELVAYQKVKDEPWTIGWGNTMYADNRPVRRGDHITRPQADELFHLVAPKYERLVSGLVTRQLTQNQFDALVDFAYNCGSGYTNAKGKFQLYNIWQNVSAGMSGKALYDYWTKLAITSSGVELAGLKRRRKSEATLYISGVLNFFL